MVLCKFFQQGHCRFGQSCRFEHSYASKYSYHANAPQQTSHNAPVAPGSDDYLTAQLIADSSSVLHGGQWLLSSYTPFNGKPSFPGLMNLSFEEARLFVYEAKANNTLDNAISHLNQLTQDARSKYEQLSRPTPQILKVYKSVFNGESPPSPFSNNANPFVSGSGGANPGSVFKSAAQGSVFANQASPTSIFAQNNATPFNQQANQAKSIFAQASHNMFPQQQESIFASPPANPASIFASANQNTPAPQANVFAQAPVPTQNTGSIFGNWQQQAAPQNQAQSIFAQAAETAPSNVFAHATQPQPQSIFQTSAPTGSIFAQPPSQGSFQPHDIGVYSKMEELSQEDIEMYSSPDFRLGFVPEMPPPQSLCM